MAETSKNSVKLSIEYEKDAEDKSKTITYNFIKPSATNEAIYSAGEAIASMQDRGASAFYKVVESELERNL